MLLEKISDFVKKSKLNAISFSLALILLLILYFVLFFQQGMMFEGEFLTKHRSKDQILYKSDSLWGEIKIFLIGDKNNSETSEVIYELPGDINRYFTVRYIDADNWYEGIKEISENGETIFRGSYNYGHLMTEEGRPYIGDIEITVSTSIGGIEESPFKKPYELSLTHVAVTAASHGDESRGEFKFMLLGIFILFVTFIDFIAPMLFWSIKYSLWTNSDEPSDMFITFQRAGWTVLPVIGIILLLIALIP